MGHLHHHPAPSLVDDEGEAFARAVFCRFLRQATISRDIDDVIEVRINEGPLLFLPVGAHQTQTVVVRPDEGREREPTPAAATALWCGKPESVHQDYEPRARSERFC